MFRYDALTLRSPGDAIGTTGRVAGELRTDLCQVGGRSRGTRNVSLSSRLDRVQEHRREDAFRSEVLIGLYLCLFCWVTFLRFVVCL